ncbi:hypothetical protein [Ekhidna sp.]|uniref:hypothetical protein n=1 Tax=Ekhidna sp. TaxID=2608089 RepID=UPI0032996480
MKRLLLILCYASLMSCQDKVICPAFQSTYILDDSTRNAYFSYVWQLDENTRAQYLATQQGGNTEDTLGVVAQPKTDYYAYAGEKVVPWRVQKKSKYGIIKQPIYPIKSYQMRTAPMENVLAPEPISNNFVASDFSDSLGVDSLTIAMDSLSLDSATVKPVVAKEETKYLYEYDPSDNFNVEQEYYNKYFGEKFIDNRPKPEPVPVATDSLGNPLPDSLQTKEPFFKGLFKKKKKEETPLDDTPEEATPPEPEEGTTEENGEEGGEEGGNG